MYILSLTCGCNEKICATISGVTITTLPPAPAAAAAATVEGDVDAEPFKAKVTRFLRLVGDYDHTFQDDLRDDSRTNLPIVIRDAETGEYERALRQEEKRLRLDALFSYQPTPGTVVFVGYGSTAAEPNDLRASSLRRVEDGFFVKVSYLFRL